MLRGYRKTPVLEPGASAEVSFGLTAEGLSTWDKRWRPARGDLIMAAMRRPKDENALARLN